MAKTNDFTQMFENMMGGKMFDATPANDMVKSATEFGAKMNKIVLEAAAKNTELAFGWTRETLDNLQKFADPSIEPAGLAKVSGEAMNAQMQVAPEFMTKFAEVAKTAQTQAIELMTEAGKNMQNEATKAVKKAA